MPRGCMSSRVRACTASAREVVDGVLDELGREGVAVRLVERSILDEPALAAAYFQEFCTVGQAEAGR